MGSYNVRQDLTRFRKDASALLEISRSRRKLALKLGFLSDNLAMINEILCTLDRSRYCRINTGTNELTGEQVQLKSKLEAHKRDALFMIGYSRGYGPRQIMFDHQRLLDLNKKQRRVGSLSKIEEAEKRIVQEQIRVLYQNDPETKARERRKQLIAHERKYSLTTHQKHELSLIDKLYPGSDPQYPDYNLPAEGMRIPDVDWSKWVSAPKPRPDLATSYDLYQLPLIRTRGPIGAIRGT